MSYLVLARKYRPQTFTDITGQEHVTRTLTNAIEQDRVHHAFLFCGARGVGKTTAARVMAKALNCDNGPTPTPCGTCKPCLEIAASNAIDVYEIDGASNRGIGEIRELRDGVAYAPQRDRYKIYIIDEVHMLTTEAFNALLKTLEEPPSHVKFIFATTEPHKIPITILSRCQRFDFKRIPLGIMVGRLEEILASEGIAIDNASLRLIARESEGSMRDALSLTDRIISFCGDNAEFEQVAKILGVADRGWLKELVEAALAREAPRALAVVQEAFNFGTDIKQFSHDLVHYLRDIIMLRVAGTKGSLTDLSDEETQALAGLGQGHQVADLQRLFAVITAAAERLAQASFPRLELEMAVIRMCETRPLVPIDGLLRRLESLERHLESGAPLPPPGSPPSSSGGQGGSGPAPGGGGGGSTGGPGPTRNMSAAPAQAAKPEPQRASPPPQAPAPEREAEPVAATPPKTEPKAVAQPSALPKGPAETSQHAADPAPASSQEPAPTQQRAADPAPASSQEPAPTKQPAAAPAPASSQEPAPSQQPAVTPARAEPDASQQRTAAPTPPPSHAEPSSRPTPPPPESPHAPSSPRPDQAAAPQENTPSDLSQRPPSVPKTEPETPQRADVEPAEVEPIALDEYEPDPSLPPLTFSNDDWEAFVDSVTPTDARMAATLSRAQVIGASKRSLRLGFVHSSQSAETARQFNRTISALLSKHLDAYATIAVEEIESVGDCPYERREARHRAMLERRRKTVETHPAVAEVLKRFNGRLKHVQAYDPREQHA